jgi:putative ABC transport system permease protein
MIRQVRVAFRNILRNSALSIINITGLAIGIMAVQMLFQYIRFEKSYDRFFENSSRIHRLVLYRHYQTGLDKSVGNNYYVGQVAFDNLPAIENFCRCKRETQFIEAGEQIYRVERTLFADSSYFDIFSHEVISGNIEDFLGRPGDVVLTESAARKYFGNINPVGKLIFAVNPGKKPLIVQGVIKDCPENTHLKFDIVISLSSLTDKSYCYACNNTNTYFLLRKEANTDSVERQVTRLALANFKERNVELGFPLEYHLQPLSDIHLHSNYRFEYEANGNNKYLVILETIALLILLSAGLNYYNLFSSIARKRTGGIGMRIINGASAKDVIREFSVEALIIGILSLFAAYLLLGILFPLLKNMLDLNFGFSSVFSPGTILVPATAVIIISISTACFLGIKIFRFSPARFVKKEFSFAGRKKSGRYLLLLLQFTIITVLLGMAAGTINQIAYMKKDAFPMDTKNVLVVKRPVAGEFNNSQMSFQESVMKYPGVKKYTFSTITPGEKNNWVKGGICLKGREKSGNQFFQSDVSPGFFDFFKVKLIEGRLFFPDENNWLGGPRHLILNKEAALALDQDSFKNVIGQTLYDSDMKEDIGEIVGIVDGFFQNSLDQSVKPTIFNCDQAGYYIFIKYGNVNTGDLINKVRSEFQKYFKGQYFEYFFLDDFFNLQYKPHIQLFRCFMLFSIIAIIITSLSLLGTILISSDSRTKEIGIRKISGSGIFEILYLLNKEMLMIIVLASVISLPVIYIAMNAWLSGFAYRTGPGTGIFLFSVGVALAISLLTVSRQCWVSATKNPVQALRHE